MTIRAAVDIGGTFTDVVAYDDRQDALLLGKALSTPGDLIDGITNAMDASRATLHEVDLLIHGSTVVVNALIERDGADTALLTTKGFRDIYEIGRINRPDAFNLTFSKHDPLIDRDAVFEVPERIRADGSVWTPLDEDAVREIGHQLAERGFQAVAVVLLHAYRNPMHEQRIGEILREIVPGAYVTLSHDISREYREFERTSTTVANAFVGPIVSAYLRRLSSTVADANAEASVAIMQSNGGISDVATAERQCIQMLESGPAGGVVGTIAVCRELGLSEAIAFDMGGTTAKSAVIRDLGLPLASDYFLGGYQTGLPIRIPCIDIVEVGTGGGSIAWVDDAGGVHVGPHSAGAEPGPASYARGGSEATITDATVVLGQLAPDGELFGGLKLDSRAAAEAVGRVAERISLAPAATAAGIVAIGAASMANSVRAVTTQRGLDPREFTLVAYGGNGPLHVSLVARELGIRQVVIPPHPAVFSAWGMLVADLRTDVVETKVTPLSEAHGTQVLDDFATLEAECEKALRDSAVVAEHIGFERSVDMRYVGQEHTVTVTVPTSAPDFVVALKAAFDAAHLQRYSHSAADESAEIVSLRVSAIGSLSKPNLPRIREGGPEPATGACRGERDIVFEPDVGPVRTPVFARSALHAGNEIVGPAVIEEPTATTLLRPDDRVVVDRLGALHMTIGA